MAAIIRWLLVVFWMSAIFGLSSIPSLHVPFAHSDAFVFRNLAHIGKYAELIALLCWALQSYEGRHMKAVGSERGSSRRCPRGSTGSPR